MQLKYKLLKTDEAVGIAPKKMTEDSVCYDLYTPIDIVLHPNRISVTSLLISFDIPKGYYIEIYPRSSLQVKYDIISSTSIIDTDYKKEVHAILFNSSTEKRFLKAGSRILQFMLKNKIDTNLIEVNEIKDTGRGGLGSTNDK